MGLCVIDFHVLPGPRGLPLPPWVAVIAFDRPGIAIAGALVRGPLLFPGSESRPAGNRTEAVHAPADLSGSAAATRTVLTIALVVISGCLASSTVCGSIFVRALNRRVRRRLLENKEAEARATQRAALRQSEIVKRRQLEAAIRERHLREKQRKVAVTKVTLSAGAAEEMNVPYTKPSSRKSRPDVTGLWYVRISRVECVTV
jgi:hypothetical protein